MIENRNDFIENFLKRVADGEFWDYGLSNINYSDIDAFMKKADESDLEDIETLMDIWYNSPNNEDIDIDELETTVYNVLER